ncbi:hypothetical protein WKI71_00900 [Streptomyces sp. MS1.AVA.1]|uniref:Uncharacterized protein n=1 Tax=Streptomyces machairae TaxID=3134109 RepID=A0ABU8UFG3_9ACTN
MTNQQVLAVCRSNWEYRGIDDGSVREMLDELSAHLEDAAAAGRTPQDVVGDDVKEFAASWARPELPSPTAVAHGGDGLLRDRLAAAGHVPGPVDHRTGREH